MKDNQEWKAFVERVISGEIIIDSYIGSPPDKNGQLFEMARIGYIPYVQGAKDGEYEIYVNSDDEGKIPHFHIRNTNDWSKFHTCIEFRRPKYFHHGNKQDVLNTKMKKELMRFFRAKTNIGRVRVIDLTNWDLACIDWNKNNSDVMLPDDMKMPNYKLLQ